MTYTAAADPLVDTLLAAITPPAGWTKVATKAPPPKYEPNKVYCWALRQQPHNVNTGDAVELWFYLRLAWSVGTDEEKGQIRLTPTSDTIDNGLATVQTAVVANRTSPVWEWIQVDTTDPQAIITFDERAGWVDLSGYRLF
jgi:hypothetical protein